MFVEHDMNKTKKNVKLFIYLSMFVELNKEMQ